LEGAHLMPTKRHRRQRAPAYSPVVQALLDNRLIERTPENREELERLRHGAFRESPTREMPFLVGFARAELERWHRETQ
jgi:hypothetical protein